MAESKYKPEMCNLIIEFMSQGMSLHEVCARIGISRETLNQWRSKDGDYFNSEVSDAVKRGIDLSEAWWLERGRENLTNRDFSAVLWYMNMKNRFGWADKHEHTGKDGEAIKTDLTLNIKFV